MIFQSPSFLWALTALAIPVIIHLFNFRKTTRIYFSNTRFLKQVKQETTQKRKLKQFLVLAARLLFILFLVLAFAQPLLPPTDQIGAQDKIAVYLDNSLSMSAPVSNKQRALDDALQMVFGLVETMPLNTRYQIITNDFAPFSNSYRSKSEVVDFLSQIRLSSISRTANDVVHRLVEKNTTLFWFSDLQRSTLGSLSQPDSTLNVKLIPVTYSPVSNVLVDTVYIENPLVAAGGEKNAVTVRLRNVGSREVDGLVVKLVINSIQASAATVRIEPNSVTPISFDLTNTSSGLNKAVVTFSDYPISFDNEFYFTLNYAKKLKIVEIKNVNEITAFERVYGNKELFSFSSLQAANINFSSLRSADLIVINQLDRIEPSLLAAISSLRKAHSIMLIPGLKPQLDSYKGLVGTIAKITGEEKPQALDLPDFKNPLFQNVFEEKNSSIAMPTATKLLDWGSDRSAILKFKDGRPFMSQLQNVFVLACPLAKGFTDFYTHALFVPIMYRIASMDRQQEQAAYYQLSSTVFSIPADSLKGESLIKMIGKQEVIPTQRRTDNQVVLEVPKYLLERGFYHIVYQKDTLGLVAFNLAKEESVLENLSGEEAKARLGGGPLISIFNAGNASAFRNEIKQNYLGTPLWKLSILLAILFLLAEVLLLRFLK